MLPAFPVKWSVLVILLGVGRFATAEEPQPEASDPWVVENSQAAEKDFAIWKTTGEVPADFAQHAAKGERSDLTDRVLTGDRLEETEIKPGNEVQTCEVQILASAPLETAVFEREHQTVWRRITKDRFEIWTPKEGRLFDSTGKLLNTAAVHRTDGWGREWYGAFLADGLWTTTDIGELDYRLTVFSKKGKKLRTLKANTLVSLTEEDAENVALTSPVPLIAWARADKTGKAWIVSVGSEFGRGYVKVTPDGISSKVDCPWTECLPQQLGTRGMYTSLYSMSDDGVSTVCRNEPSHGVMVGWPKYDFPAKTSVLIHAGGKMGILPAAWAIFVNPEGNALDVTAEDRVQERVWLFDAKGNYQHWIKGRSAGTSAKTDGLWIRLPDSSIFCLEKGYKPGLHLTFVTMEKQPLLPIELYDDIGLGIFLSGDQLVLGKWQPKK